MIRQAATLVLLAALAVLGTAQPLEAGRHKSVPANQCRTGERVIFSCRVGRKVGSVCAGAKSLHYRFGPLGKPEITVSSKPDWSNIHMWGNRSQGGLNQDQIRFTNGDTHYVVFDGETGSLNENPGVRFSGIAVIRGSSSEGLVATLDCKANPGLSAAKQWNPPDGWDGWQDDDDPFNAIF